ncbi:radical SAM protein, partial [Streptococcus thermophilus]
KIETVTNGTVLNKRVKEMLVKFHPYLTISLDGPEIVHDRLRGRGSHRKTLRFINYLKNIDYENFEIASTYTRLHQKNGLSREDIFQYFTDMDVHFNIN